MSLEVLRGPLCNSSEHVILLMYTPVNSKLNPSLYIGVCVRACVRACVCDLCLWIASSPELLLSFSATRTHLLHY